MPSRTPTKDTQKQWTREAKRVGAREQTVGERESVEQEGGASGGKQEREEITEKDRVTHVHVAGSEATRGTP
jgi:hypothetical protein